LEDFKFQCSRNGKNANGIEYKKRAMSRYKKLSNLLSNLLIYRTGFYNFISKGNTIQTPGLKKYVTSLLRSQHETSFSKEEELIMFKKH